MALQMSTLWAKVAAGSPEADPPMYQGVKKMWSQVAFNLQASHMHTENGCYDLASAGRLGTSSSLGQSTEEVSVAYPMSGLRTFMLHIALSKTLMTVPHSSPS